MLERYEHEGQITYTLDKGLKFTVNKCRPGPVAAALDELSQFQAVAATPQMLEVLIRSHENRINQLERACHQLMSMDCDRICDILAADSDGRLTIWPRTGEELFFVARGACENCPVSEKCPKEFASGECPSYVMSEVWFGNDTDQMFDYLNGEYFFDRKSAQSTIKSEKEIRE